MKERMKVMIAYDGSSYADAAIDEVYRAGLPPKPEILVVSVVEPLDFGPSVSEFDMRSPISRRASLVIGQVRAHSRREIEEVKESAARALERLRSRFPEAKIRFDVLHGKPAAEILRRADEWQPDLIVVGSHGRTAIGRFFLGSVSQKVAESANFPVRVVHRRSAHDGAPSNIMAGAGGLNGAKEVVRSRIW